VTPDNAEKTRENRSRRAAERQGIALSKVRRIDTRAIDYGTWILDDPRRSVHLTGLSLEQVEHYLDHGPGD
jgi:hypothetical protein